MRYDDIVARGPTPRKVEDAVRMHAGHAHMRAGLSRRQFLGTAAGVTAFGAAVGAGLLSSSAAQAASSTPGIGQVLPISSSLEIFPGHSYHVQGPPFTGVDADPSTVYNFNGASAIAFISGTVERTNRKTGETRTLPYSFNDMRIMQGQVRGRDGHVRDGTFALV